MKSPKQIEEVIAARKAEMQSLADTHQHKANELQKVVDAHNQQTIEVQSRLLYLKGCVEELTALLPKPKADKSPKKKR